MNLATAIQRAPVMLRSALRDLRHGRPLGGTVRSRHEHLGAFHATVACAFPGATVSRDGAEGTPIVTAFDGGDCFPVPSALWAATLNVYVLPFFSPATTSLVLLEWNDTVVWALAPMYGVTT